MRVSKLVREYIERKVSEAYPHGNTPEYQAAIDSLEAFRAVVNLEVKELVNSRIAEFRASNDFPCGAVVEPSNNVSWNQVNFSLFNTELYNKNEANSKAMRKKREAAIENILLTLELGGNKADLERMLSELTNQ